VDGRTTRKLNANIASAVMSRLEKHLLLAKQRGWMRNEWIEAALDHAVRTDFMPELEQSSNDTETPP
jgi:hypothetical protein